MAAEEDQPSLAASIRAIDKGDVHRICSGQVVLTLATAIKELVENSIDAGATSIEVKLKEFGAELVEVSDNGSGVESGNFQALTLKHHTSKLKDFGDLINVQTFGFRGEALSSLCALSRLSVITRHADSSIGSRLVFDHNGKLTEESAVHRQKGTTVILEDLFSTLPVRHSEFQRNLKKEFSRMLHILSAYCLISVGVRISCTHHTKGKRNVVLSTQSSSSRRDNITSVFGAKQIQALIEFEQINANDTVCEEFGLKPAELSSSIFKISGFVSSPASGSGRSSTDRQFYFINGRPCDPQKMARIVNEAYHVFNRHQFPFVLLNISLIKDAVDINVTPDKRQIFIQHEKVLLATIKTSLLKMFEKGSTLYRVNQPQPLLQFAKSPASNSPQSCKSFSINQLPCSTPTSTTPRRFSVENMKRTFSSTFSKTPETVLSPLKKGRKIESFFSKSCEKSRLSLNTSTNDTSTDSEEESRLRKSSPSSPLSPLKKINSSSTSWTILKARKSSEPEKEDHCITGSDMAGTEDSVCSPLRLVDELEVGSSVDETVTEAKTDVVVEQSQIPSMNLRVIKTDQVFVAGKKKREKLITFDMKKLKSALQNLSLASQSQTSLAVLSFRAKINPSDNQSAEEELQREIRKDSFCQMQVLGQFNLGFIITMLGRDLFIVDQHASDEKYNFEMLQRHTALSNQRLVNPQPLILTAANEITLIENLSIFEKNGFLFEVNEDALPTQRVKLLSKPVSKNWEFGREDIEEMLFVLSDSPGVMCRPSRIRQMFASRACRKSIMIGTALNKSQMAKVMNHMSEIDHPWNCPHGRPTMRHLISLDRLCL